MATEVHPELLDTFVIDLGIITYAGAHWRCEILSTQFLTAETSDPPH